MGCKKTENESEFTLFVNSECWRIYFDQRMRNRYHYPNELLWLSKSNHLYWVVFLSI